MTQRKYLYVVPILTSALFLASLAGLITNAVTFNETTVRNFQITNIEAGQFKTNVVTIPSSMGRAQLKFDMAIIQDGISGSPVIDVYLFDDQLPTSITNISSLLDSDYFSNSLILFQTGVENQVTFYLPEDYEEVYVVFANPSSSQDYNLVVTVEITDESSFNDAGSVVKVIAIVIASILTLVFFLASIYFWIEVLGYEYFEPKLLTLSLEKRMTQFVDKAESWEVFLLAASLFLIPSGLASWLIADLDNALPFTGIILILVVAFSYNNRNRTYDAIRSVLSQQKQVTLKRLSEIIEKEKKDTKKAVMNLILYENYPATYDYDNEVITYHDDGVTPEKRKSELGQAIGPLITKQSSFEVPNEEMVAGSTTLEVEPTRPLPECAYCGEEAIIHNAQFCHSCGASMVSAK